MNFAKNSDMIIILDMEKFFWNFFFNNNRPLVCQFSHKYFEEKLDLYF